MRRIILLFMLICVQTMFAQHIFKSDSEIVELESIQDGQSRTRASVYYSDVYKTSVGDTLTIEPIIALKVKDGKVLSEITRQFAGKLTFSEKLGNVYYLDCNAQNSEEVLNITSQLCKHKDVIACDAVHYSSLHLFGDLCSKQYYLHNLVQGIDIAAESAWREAPLLGQGVVVAVIDQGVDRDHEDLDNVLEGYTAELAIGKGEPVNPINTNPKAHGMACAGIIGAGNNSIGVRGVASNCRLLPVNICPYADINGFTNDYEIAKAIRWASARADILSCSWGGNGVRSLSIGEAIKDALANGRNGKGCIIVCSSGNYASEFNYIAYPASETGVISVGAVDRNGKIWDYSQRGEGLCLVAPSGNGNSSSDIVTTDRMGSLGYTSGNYTEHFGGTSAACPQVAGVAALMLSLNPNLTAAEVKQILQSTATDLGTSGYDTTYGYGLLNAYAAVSEVLPTIINGQNAVKQKGDYSLSVLPVGASVAWSIPAADTDKVTLSASGNSCTLELKGNKTVRTTLTATISMNGTEVKSISKTVGLVGTFSGTYSVSATNASQAITNRPFYASSTLESYSGATVTGKSDDFYCYSASLSGISVSNWTYGNGQFSFTAPQNTSGQTVVKLTPLFAGGSNISFKVYTTKTTYAMSLALAGNSLHVAIEKEELPVETEEGIAIASVCEELDNTVWTIEVYNTAATMKQAIGTTTNSACQFDTSSWSKGTYLIRATNGNQIITKQIVIP